MTGKEYVRGPVSLEAVALKELGVMRKRVLEVVSRLRVRGKGMPETERRLP